MFVIHHQPTNSVKNNKHSVICFPNVTHARQVAQNLAEYRYVHSHFPTSDNIKQVLKPITNDFVMDFDDYNLEVNHMSRYKLLQMSLRANLNISICILSKYNKDNCFMITIPTDKNELYFPNYLDVCFEKSC